MRLANVRRLACVVFRTAREVTGAQRISPNEISAISLRILSVVSSGEGFRVLLLPACGQVGQVGRATDMQELGRVGKSVGPCTHHGSMCCVLLPAPAGVPPPPPPAAAPGDPGDPCPSALQPAVLLAAHAPIVRESWQSGRLDSRRGVMSVRGSRQQAMHSDIDVVPVLPYRASRNRPSAPATSPLCCVWASGRSPRCLA